MGVWKDIRRTLCCVFCFLCVDCYLGVFAQTLEGSIVFCFLKGVCCPFAAIAFIPNLLLGLTEPEPKHYGAVQFVAVTTSPSPVPLSNDNDKINLLSSSR